MGTGLLFVLLAIVIAGALGFYAVLKHKNMDIWFGAYVRGKLTHRRPAHSGPTHIMFCFVDHYEPQWRSPDYDTECERVDRWHREYPVIAGKHRDADGVHPQHTFFYPEEEYREEHLDKIADLCKRGFGEIEVHLHHDNDTPENFRESLARFVELLHTRHGAFSPDPRTGKLAWSFIHGDWALCNSLPDGACCGINEELTILRELGCYCDMTLPSAPSAAQTKTINSLYYAENKPGEPKSHDTGVPVQVGVEASGDLMIIQGPLSLNWQNRKKGILPAIENSDIKLDNPPTEKRVDIWVDTGIHVQGRPEWIFVKVHTHGTQDGDMEANLSSPCDDMYSYLESRYNDGENYVLHYTSAREMYNIVKAAEAGETGNPNKYRDYVIPRPEYT
jgi:hypothetical protein